MNDPTPSRNLYAALSLLGLLGGIYALLYHNSDNIIPFIIGMISLFVLPLAFVMFLTVAFDAARYGRLKRGKGILARWTVPVEEWNAFVVTVGAVQGTRLIRTEPMDIVIAETGMMIGDYFTPLPHNGTMAIAPPKLVAGSPRRLEFQMWSSGSSDTSGSEFSAMVPVPNAVAAEDVRRIQQYFEEHLALAKQWRAAGKKP